MNEPDSIASTSVSWFGHLNGAVLASLAVEAWTLVHVHLRVM